MTEHDDERRAVGRGRELDAADLRRGDDVAGDADHEQVTEPWSKTSSAGTRESEQPKTMADGFCPATSCCAASRWSISDSSLAGNVAPITLSQLRRGFESLFHCSRILQRTRVASNRNGRYSAAPERENENSNPPGGRAKTFI